VAQHPDRWPLAGDQLFVDLDLSAENLPPETELMLGSAVIEVTKQPHLGCAKFVERFGLDAVKFVNSDDGKEIHLRGINARVLYPSFGWGRRKRERARGRGGRVFEDHPDPSLPPLIQLRARESLRFVSQVEFWQTAINRSDSY
jgi:hypothetical protein